MQCNYIDTLLHRLTTWTASSELWQWTRHKIVVISLTDHRYVPPHRIVLPDVTTWPKTKRHTTICLIGHYVHHVVRKACSVMQHVYMDFLRRARKQAEEIREKDHIFHSHLEKCTWGYMQSRRDSFSRTP